MPTDLSSPDGLPRKVRTMSATLTRHELETREHELRKMRMVMVDGALTVNLRTTQRGLSARA
jgi:hypothetical protein